MGCRNCRVHGRKRHSGVAKNRGYVNVDQSQPEARGVGGSDNKGSFWAAERLTTLFLAGVGARALDLLGA